MDEQVVTDTNKAWMSVGLSYNGMESDWERRGKGAQGEGAGKDTERRKWCQSEAGDSGGYGRGVQSGS